MNEIETRIAKIDFMKNAMEKSNDPKTIDLYKAKIEEAEAKLEELIGVLIS